jgi:hypothetical protein
MVDSKNLYLINQTHVLGWYGEAERAQGIWRSLHGGLPGLEVIGTRLVAPTNQLFVKGGYTCSVFGGLPRF